MRLSITASATHAALAQHWAALLNLPFEENPGPEVEGLLQVSEAGLSLCENKAHGLKLHIDFIKGRMGYRRQALSHEVLASVLGLKKKPAPQVLDLTAGWGSDAFLMAALGCSVIALERHPIVAALLSDALARAQSLPELQPIVARLTLRQIDAKLYLQNPDPRPDIIYCDPMFPERRKSARVKKEMIILQQLLGEGDPNEPQLLVDLALQLGVRIIVKRPTHAPPLHKAHHRVWMARSCRFDIYDKV